MLADADRKTYYNRCDPEVPLGPTDSRNVDIDRLFPDAPVRGAVWAKHLFDLFNMSDSPTCRLFSGFPGSGKTTEINRLMALLESSNFRPIYIDALEYIDPNNVIEASDILNVVLYMVAKSAGTDLTIAAPFLQRVWKFLTTNVELDSVKLVSGIGDMVLKAKLQPDLRQRVRDSIKSGFYEYLQEVRDALTVLEETVKEQHSGKRLVVIVDSLEKMRGFSSNWHEVLDSVERTFRGHDAPIRLPVHVLYTVPAVLATRIPGVLVLPSIKVRDRHGDPHHNGMQAMRRLIFQRIKEEDVASLLGSDHARLLDDIILESGGHMRQVLRVLRAMLLRGPDTTPERALARAHAEVANDYKQIVTADAYPWLAMVRKQRELVIQDDAHRQHAERLLQDHAVLRYQNDDLWFDLHPSVARIDGVQALLDNAD